MQRYFVQPAQLQAEVVEIIGDDARHIAKVMRGASGDRIIVSNGRDREVEALLEVVDSSRVLARVDVERVMDRETHHRFWIAQSMPKADKFELVIQKGTELGATGFIPFSSERTIVQYDERKAGKRIDRWQKIAKEAAEQSHRNVVPVIEEPRSWKQVLQQIAEVDHAFLLYEKEHERGLRSELTKLTQCQGDAPSQSFLIIVGPEGGLSEKEVEEAAAAGAVVVTIGKRILRTETAPIAALCCLLYEFNEMGD